METRAARHDATLTPWQRRGPVFSDRYHSEVGRSVSQAWHLIGYVLRNPHAAGLPEARRGWDPFVGANDSVLGSNPFCWFRTF